MKTAEEIKNEYWTTGKQWHIARKGTKDGIVVLMNNPPCGRCRSPFLDFLIFKNGKEVGSESSYVEMQKSVNRLKQELM